MTWGKYGKRSNLQCEMKSSASSAPASASPLAWCPGWHQFSGTSSLHFSSAWVPLHRKSFALRVLATQRKDSVWLGTVPALGNRRTHVWRHDHVSQH